MWNNYESPDTIAAGLLRIYEARDAAFGGDLFRSPAWEILLRVQLAPEGLTAERLCQAIGTTTSLTLRWTALLIERGLVSVVIQEGEPTYELTETGKAGLVGALQAMAP